MWFKWLTWFHLSYSYSICWPQALLFCIEKVWTFTLQRENQLVATVFANVKQETLIVEQKSLAKLFMACLNACFPCVQLPCFYTVKPEWTGIRISCFFKTLFLETFCWGQQVASLCAQKRCWDKFSKANYVIHKTCIFCLMSTVGGNVPLATHLLSLVIRQQVFDLTSRGMLNTPLLTCFFFWNDVFTPMWSSVQRKVLSSPRFDACSTARGRKDFL